MGKLNQDSFVVDEVLTALVGEGEKESKKESKKDKKPKESKKDSKKDKKSKDKKSNKKEKEIKIAKNNKADTDGDIIDIEIEEITSSAAAKKATGNYVPEDVKEELKKQYKQKPQGVRTIDNKVLLFTELIQSIGNVKPNNMCNALGKEVFVQFVEWAIENKHSVPTEYLEKSIDIKDTLDSSTKKSKDKKSDKKDKKKKSKDKDKKKDKKDKDKKSDKKDKKKKSKKDDDDKKSKKKGKKKKSKPTTDDEDIKRAFKKAKKQDKQEEEILSDADIDALTTIEINFDL